MQCWSRYKSICSQQQATACDATIAAVAYYEVAGRSDVGIANCSRASPSSLRIFDKHVLWTIIGQAERALIVLKPAHALEVQDADVLHKCCHCQNVGKLFIALA